MYIKYNYGYFDKCENSYFLKFIVLSILKRRVILVAIARFYWLSHHYFKILKETLWKIGRKKEFFQIDVLTRI